MTAPVDTPQIGPAPQELLDVFEQLFADQQRITAELIRVTDLIHGAARPSEQQFVADELGLLMTCHPETASGFVARSVLACAIPGLMSAMQAGELTERHVHAAASELRACLSNPDEQQAVLAVVLERCRARVAVPGRRWPFPSELRRMLRKEALAFDPGSAERRRKRTVADREVSVSPLPDGAYALGITGPAEQVAAMHQAIDRYAGTLAGPGDERSRAQLRFDAAYALLTGADPAIAGVSVALAQIVVPISTALGGSLEVGELPGYGPLLPSTCRDLLERAETVQRVLIDAGSGQLLAVEDPQPHDGDWLGWLLTQPVTLPHPRTSPDGTMSLAGRVPAQPVGAGAYRPSRRMITFVKTRDRGCRFPGCTRPAHGCDVDHRTVWPLGPTEACNLQCLCRHHHQAKQSSLFTCTLHPDGVTVVWTTRTGRTYHVPPPDW